MTPKQQRQQREFECGLRFAGMLIGILALLALVAIVGSMRL